MSERILLAGGKETPQPAAPAADFLSGNGLRLARATWIVVAIIALGILLAALPGYGQKAAGQLAHVSGGHLPAGAHFFAVTSAIASLASTFLSLLLAILLFRRRFQEPMAAFLSYFLLIYAVVMAGPIEMASAYWLHSPAVAERAQGLLVTVPLIALLMLFPTGRFVPGWTRWVVLLSWVWGLSLPLIGGFNGESVRQQPLLFAILAAAFIAFLLSGIYAQVYRYRKISGPGEKEQLRWVFYGLTLWIGYMLFSTVPYIYLTGLPADTPTPWWGPASELGWWLSLNILPLCLTVAVMRYRLWEIDLVVNRTLVYGGLTASILALYALVVGGMGVLLGTQDNLLLSLLATGLAALLFHPLRLKLQQAINRMMYGERDEPFEVLARLGERLENTLSPEMVYPTIVETVAQTLKLPYVAIAVWRQGRSQIVESYGKPATDTVAYPLTYQGEAVGELQVASRSPAEAFTPADERILQNLARQAGAAVHALQLLADLQESRQRLVTAREEERRRLRRDLHDGLGPQLASQTLTIDAVEKLLTRDPDRAQALLRDLKAQSQTAIQDIRRLVYDLRPPALDELGLAGALAEGITRQTQNGLQIELAAPASLPPLPAAVEVAAYRIAQEALTNVIRHAGAGTATVHLALVPGGAKSALRLVIQDDGRGLPPACEAGVGMQSMRERAAELGGSFQIESVAGGGVRVTAVFPLPAG